MSHNEAFSELVTFCREFHITGWTFHGRQHLYSQLSTVPDCRMRAPRRRNTSTSAAQNWRFVPDAILPGHRRAHWWVPARTPTVHQCPHSGKAVGGSTALHGDTTHRCQSSLVSAQFITKIISSLHTKCVFFDPEFCNALLLFFRPLISLYFCS